MNSQVAIDILPPLARVDVRPEHTLDDYAAVAHLAAAAGELKAEAVRLVPRLVGRTVWLVNSTATGGGVAEMLPPIRNPEDETELRQAIDEMLAAPDRLNRMGGSAQRRVHDEFLVLAQLRNWGRVIAAAIEPRAAGG